MYAPNRAHCSVFDDNCQPDGGANLYEYAATNMIAATAKMIHEILRMRNQNTFLTVSATTRPGGSR
jgi:hypothetical protein